MQAHAYFLPEIRAQFLAYAKRVGLDGAQLLRLLILRELTGRRLLDEQKAGKLEPPKQQRRSSERPKVTARLKDNADIAAFRSYIHSLGIGSNRVTSHIAHCELRDRVLERLVRGRVQRRLARR